MKQKYVLRKIGKHLCNVVLVAGTSAQLLAPLVHADEAPASPATEVAEGAPVLKWRHQRRLHQHQLQLKQKETQQWNLKEL